MDRFTNYNNGDGYDNPNNNGYEPVGSYNNPEYTETIGYNEINGYTETTGYTDASGYSETAEYTDVSGYSETTGYTDANGYSETTGYTNANEYFETTGYTNANGYSETATYGEATEYDTPNYEGVRLMDVSYSNEEYEDTSEYEEMPSSTENANQTTYNEDSIFSPLYPEGYAPTPKPDAAFQPKSQRSDYNEEELTEEELADIRRQKAAARRKKLAARERRRRERRKQAIIRCSILLAIVILLIVGFVMLISGLVDHFKEKQKERELSEYYATSEITTEDPVAEIDPEITAKVLPADRDAALGILKKQAENDSTMQSICDSAAAIPDIILQNLAINPEMKDFTLSYPAMINIVFDGEFDVEIESSDIPLYLQFDKRWGYADYSTDIIGLRGAGPTTLSMAYTYLTKDGSKNPIKVADYATEKGYLDEDGQTHWTLMTEGAEGLGLKSTEINIEKDAIIRAIEDKKVVVCMVSKGDFTTDKNFIIIRDYKDGFFYVNDPTSTERSQVGWDFRRLRSQIDKMCALEADANASTKSEASDNAQENNATGNENPEAGETTNNETTTPAE